MSRYIDADLLMKELGITDPDCEKCEWGCKSFPSCTRGSDFVDACIAICEAPTADVPERNVGKWISIKVGNGDTRYTCSECGASYECDSRDAWDFLFCPNCGAQLGKRRTDE